MNFSTKSAIAPSHLPGRTIWTAIGKEAAVQSQDFTLGFSRFSPDQGVPPPHAHAAEALVVVAAQGCTFRFGPTESTMTGELKLEKDMVIHIQNGEWHSFEVEDGGYAEFVFFYASVNNLRPEGSGVLPQKP